MTTEEWNDKPAGGPRMTPTTLAETILRDVPRYTFDTNGELLYEREVLAALTAALDPAIAEKAGEEIESLRLWNRDDAADLITALMTANAALRVEVRKSAMDAVSAGCQAQEAWEAQKAAEAERDALRAEVKALVEALRLLHDNVVLAFPALADLGPVANARAALSTTEEGHE